jgi:glycosyltransferase involved in cell wall biosynthesis
MSAAWRPGQPDSALEKPPMVAIANKERAPLFVELSPVLERRPTGIARFTARLIEALARRTSLRLFTPGDTSDLCIERGSLPAQDGGFQDWAREVRRQPRAPHDARLAHQGTALYTALRPEVRYFGRELGILYDFTALLLPWAHDEDTRKHFTRFFDESALLCDRLIAISESTRRDATFLCARDQEAIDVVYPGPSMCVDRHACTKTVSRRQNAVLVVSALEPRKNGPFVLDWFSQTTALPADTELWWVGPKAWWSSRSWLRDLARRTRNLAADRIQFLGMVSDARLCELYQQARFTIYPSLYEGFGFPVLDSLLHGAPVACSFNSSLEEFAGPGVFYFDPCDRTSLDNACRELLSRADAGIDARMLRQRFSWGGLAQKVLELCDEI